MPMLFVTVLPSPTFGSSERSSVYGAGSATGSAASGTAGLLSIGGFLGSTNTFERQDSRLYGKETTDTTTPSRKPLDSSHSVCTCGAGGRYDSLLVVACLQLSYDDRSPPATEESMIDSLVLSTRNCGDANAL